MKVLLIIVILLVTVISIILIFISIKGIIRSHYELKEIDRQIKELQNENQKRV